MFWSLKRLGTFTRWGVPDLIFDCHIGTSQICGLVVTDLQVGVIWWLVCNASQRDWKQRELLVPVPQQGEADTADDTNADTVADNTNADTINDIWPF